MTSQNELTEIKLVPYNKPHTRPIAASNSFVAQTLDNKTLSLRVYADW
jgi:hypothetical protein